MAPEQEQPAESERSADGRFAKGNAVRLTHGFRSDRARRKRRREFQAEAERELRDDLSAPIPALLFRMTATALADLRAFEQYVAAHGGPVKTSGATLGLWPGYEGQKRLVIDLLERCGVAPARGRAARTAPARAKAAQQERAAAAQQELSRRYSPSETKGAP